jgi:hypothetical protein
MNFMKAKSIKGKSPDEIKTALQESMSDGFKPTLAIVFISIKQDRKAVSEILHKENIDLFGATSCGEFINGYQDEGGIVILLLDLNRDAYSLLYEPFGENLLSETAGKLSNRALKAFNNPSMIILSTGVNSKGDVFDGEKLVNSLESVLGAKVTYWGGMAGDDMTLSGSYVFTHGNETDFGVAALVLDGDKVTLQGMAITGWKPMGISRKVTKSAGNLVYTIDDKPAVEMYLKYLGKVENKDDKNFDLLNELSFTFPFIVERGDGETILKSPMRIDHQENALVTDMEMPQGTEFWFSMPPEFDIVEKIIEEAAQLKTASRFDADALLVFSCAGRAPALGPLVTFENEGLAEVWKSPMAGFFSYGEFGRGKNGRQYFHSGACSWVALKEK